MEKWQDKRRKKITAIGGLKDWIYAFIYGLIWTYMDLDMYYSNYIMWN